VKVGEDVEIVGFRETRKTVCTGVEMFKKQLDEGLAGDNAVFCCAAFERGCGARDGAGQAGLDYAAHRLQGEVYVLSKEEGGRHTPFFKGYRPQFYFRTTDVTEWRSCPRAWRW